MPNQDKWTLAIETSGRIGSVALAGRGVLLETQFSGYMRQSAELFPSAQNLLDRVNAAPQDISDIFISAGPGSFTGLRIAVTAAKMFHLAQQTRLIAADSLDVIAENVTDLIESAGEPVRHAAVILDAKKDHFYAAVYDLLPEGPRKCFGTVMITAAELLEWLEGSRRDEVLLLGEGLVYYADRFKAPFVRFMDREGWQPHARNLVRLGRKMAAQNLYADPVTLTPFYIRKPDAVEKAHRASLKTQPPA